MPVAAIKTEADTWVPTLERFNEIFGKSMRVLADLQFIEHDSSANSQVQKTQLSERQELCAAIINVFGKISTSVHGSITIELPKTHDTPAPALTEKQQRSIALVNKWMLEDREEQTEAMRRFMEAIDEDREGYRTLYKNR